MSALPTSSACYNLQLPPIEKDDRLNLNVRTGSASTLYNSLVFTHGGLTIGLELVHHSLSELVETFELRINNLKSTRIENYLSGELFYLRLIERTWARVEVPHGSPKPSPRMLHEICAVNGCVYIFGGVNVAEDGSLKVLNDLWEFNLDLECWTLLHAGLGYETNPLVPQPRFLHKMTPINNLTFLESKGHFGILIAGGKDSVSKDIYTNVVFDLVDKRYVGTKKNSAMLHLGRDPGLKNFDRLDNDNNLNINYKHSIIVNITDDIDHTYRRKDATSAAANSQTAAFADTDGPHTNTAKINTNADTHMTTTKEESIVVYAPVKEGSCVSNPLVLFRIGKSSFKSGKMFPSNRRKHQDLVQNSVDNYTMPINLKYPTGGLFGKNIVLTGFLPGDLNISIFIFNKPTGIWSRLNIFCNHDYGSHRFWGGFAWQSHHKVVLLGNYLTLKTTSSIRFFSLLITVSLPITNILASVELSNTPMLYKSRGHKVAGTDEYVAESSTTSSVTNMDAVSTSSESDYENQSQLRGSRRSTSRAQYYDDDDDDDDHSNFDVDANGNELVETEGGEPLAISFNDYVHYAAPKVNFTTIRSVFPPAAVTLGRIALDRYADLIADFELISANGDRIPVSLNLLMERWGRYFIEILARGYVKAVDEFENQKASDAKDLRKSKDSTDSSSSRYKSLSSKNSFDEFRDKNNPMNIPFHMNLQPPKQQVPEKESPQFRLPFQDFEGAGLFKDKDDSPPPSLGAGIGSAPEDVKREAPPPERLNVRVSSAVDPHSSETYVDDDADSIAPLVKTSLGGLKPARKDSVSSFASANSLFTSHLQDIPPQLPLPDEPIPAVPINPSFRSSSRRLSAEISSPRASLIHTLTVLRNIPSSKSPRESPFASPRNSFSGPSSSLMMMSSLEGTNSNTGSGFTTKSKPQYPPKSNSPLKQQKPSSTDSFELPSSNSNSSSASGPSSFEMKKLANKFSNFMSFVDGNPSPNHSDSLSSDASAPKTDATDEDDELGPHDTSSMFGGLLNLEDMENGKFKMEPSLIPRKLYIPFPTLSVKGFCEFLYTGQVGNKWLLVPTTLDNLAMSKFYKAPLLYDLISEVLFGIIGRKEGHILQECKKIKQHFLGLLVKTETVLDENYTFPLDEYEGLLDTVDDGYLDLTLLKKNSDYHRRHSFRKRHSLTGRGISNLIELSALDRTYKKETDIDTDVDTADNKSTKSAADSALIEGVSPRSAGPSIATNADTIDLESELDEKSSNSLSHQLSTSDEEFDIVYFSKAHVNVGNVGPKSKSVFDKQGGDMNFQSVLEEEKNDIEEEKKRIHSLTLDQLVSPTAPSPPDAAVDLIYEMAAIAGDLKMMLRAVNAKHMSKLMSQWREDTEETIVQLELKLVAEERGEEFTGYIDVERKKNSTASAATTGSESATAVETTGGLSGTTGGTGSVSGTSVTSTTGTTVNNPSSSNQGNTVNSGNSSNANGNTGALSSCPSQPVTGSHTTRSSVDSEKFNERIALKSSASSASLALSRTSTIERPATQRSFSRFSPFSKKLSFDNTKELDKKITNMIKHDEKLKHKHEKEEKSRLEKLAKEKQREKKAATLFSTPINQSPNSTLMSISTSGKKHGLLHNLSHPVTRTNTIAADELRMTSNNSASDTNSIDSGKSTKSTKKSFFHSKNRTKEVTDVSSVYLDTRIQQLKSHTSLSSMDSKVSGVTVGSSSVTKKRFGLFGKK